MSPFLSCGVALLCGVLASSLSAQTRAPGNELPSPRAFLGHDIGEDYFLADYTQLQSYWAELARRSERMTVEGIGQTSYGQQMIMAVITSPKNHRRLEELRKISGRLGRAKGLNDDEARKLAQEGRSVVWIDGGLHATETVAGQNILELVWRMVSGDSAEVRRILDQVILLVVPANPDGLEMVAKGYMATRRTGTPVLYQRYIGHDNNRDFYVCNQIEAENLNRILYERWLPQIVYNHHQSAPRGTVIFTPPFRDPFNYQFDPLVVRGIELVSAHMNHRFASEQKPGVISRTGASYSTWWNGGLRTTTYFHNMIGILTESFGSPTPTRITQTLQRRLPHGDYPDPVPSQEWHARQTIEYLETANFAILDYAARYRAELLFDFYQMGRNSIRRGSGDHWTVTPTMVRQARQATEASSRGDAGSGVFTDPELRDARGYVLPRSQPDWTSAVRFVQALEKNGIEVLQATADFEVGGRKYGAGSFVVKCDQAFRPHIIDMFEPQDHPDDRDGAGQPVRPYDLSGWTLALQMDIQFDRVLDGFDGPFEPSSGAIYPAGEVVGDNDPEGFLLDHRDLNSFVATNRLLAEGYRVEWFNDRFHLAGWDSRPGDVWIENEQGMTQKLASMAHELGVEFRGVARKPVAKTRRLRPVRIGLFDTWGGNMPTGWCEWALKEFEFPVQLVFGERLEKGKLKQDYDVLVFMTGLPGGRDLRRGRRFGRRPPDEDYIAKLQEVLPPFEDWSTLPQRAVRLSTSKTVPALREFLGDGGRIVAVGRECAKLIQHLELPVEVGPQKNGEEGERRRVPNSEFFVPGSLLAADVNTSHPVGFGSSERVAVMFRRSPVFRIMAGEGSKEIIPIVSYAQNNILMSGWAIGPEHAAGGVCALEAQVGKGRVTLFGSNVLFRGQPLCTFQWVFNAILNP